MSIQRNSSINVVGAIVPMAVMLVTIPLYLEQIGDVRYGVLALVWVLLGYFSFLEMGLGRATANQIAKAPDTQPLDRSEIFWTALLVNAGFGVLGATLLWLLGEHLLSHVVKIPEEFEKEAVAVLPWLVGAFPLVLVSSVLNGALEGRNQFFAVNLLQIASNTVFQIAPLAAVYFYGPSLEVVIPAAVVSRAMMVLPSLVACYVLVPTRLLPHFSIKRAKSLFSYGGWVAVTGVLSPLMETVDRVFIGVILGPQAVTHYSIPYQVVAKIKIIPTAISRALFPNFSKDTGDNARALAHKSLQALSLILAPLIVLAIFSLPLLMEAWIGREIAAVAAPLGQLLFFGVWVSSVAHVPFHLLQGQSRPDLVAKLHAAEVIPYLLLLWAALVHFGLWGVIVAWTTRVVIDAIALFRMSAMSEALLKIIAVPSLFIISAIALSNYISSSSIPVQLMFAMPFSVAVVAWTLPRLMRMRTRGLRYV